MIHFNDQSSPKLDYTAANACARVWLRCWLRLADFDVTNVVQAGKLAGWLAGWLVLALVEVHNGVFHNGGVIVEDDSS